MKLTARPFRQAPDRVKIKKLYRTAFPREEQMPWWLLRLLTTNPAVELTGYYDGETFCGLTFTAWREQVLFVLFLAVDDSLRGQGYGSAILSFLKENHPGKIILLNVELLEEDAPNLQERIHRMAFYKKNGFFDTGYNIREVGGVFRVLSTDPQPDMQAYQRVFGTMSLGLWKPPITKVK